MKIPKKNWGGGSGGGVGLVWGQGGYDRRIEVFWKIHQKMGGSGGWVEGVGLVGGGSQGGCERRTHFFVKIQKKVFSGGGAGGSGWGGQGGCERRIEVFVKIQKKMGGWSGGGGGVGLGVRVDVIEELKFFGKFTKNGGVGRGSGWWGGQGGCERRTEVL